MKSRLRKLEKRLFGGKRKVVSVILTNRRDKKTKKTYWEICLDPLVEDKEKGPIDPIWREFWKASKEGKLTSGEEVERLGRELEEKYPETDIRVVLISIPEPQEYIASWLSIDSEEEIKQLMKDHYDNYWHEDYEWEEIKEMYRTLKERRGLSHREV